MNTKQDACIQRTGRADLSHIRPSTDDTPLHHLGISRMISDPTVRQTVERRWRLLDENMQRTSTDVVLIYGKGIISQYGYLYYFGGYYPVLRPGFIVYARGQRPIAIYSTRSERYLAHRYGFIDDVRFAGIGDVVAGESILFKMAADIINDFRPRRVGIVGLSSLMTFDEVTLLTDHVDAQISDYTNEVLLIKQSKTEHEQACIRRTFDVAERSFDEFRNHLAAGRSFAEVAAEAERTARAGGAVDTFVFVDSGPYFLHKPTLEKISDNSLVTAYVELIGPDGYWVEKAGLFALGRPPEAAMELGAACLEALDHAEALMGSGQPVAEVVSAIERHRESINAVSGLWYGHGVGVDHDQPVLSAASSSVFREGMVISVHPSFADAAEQYGASVADVVVVGPDEASSMGRGSRSIIRL